MLNTTTAIGPHPHRTRLLGPGAQPPLPEWGADDPDRSPYLLEQWWVATMPGIGIFIVSLRFNLLGDGLRDVLDPKQR